MKKFLLYAIPTLFIAVSCLVMTGGSWLKEPLHGNQDDVMKHLQTIEYAIQKEDWQQASKSLDQANRALDTVTKRIQFSVERDDLISMHHALAKIHGSIKTKDSQAVSSELYYLYDVWESLG
ncbi:protein of unknown function [Alteribacillus persepolensis]|uniref:DUF4363 family protein n=1 Tax=Alteribacillus persepolensis TaxID=568899 RepID=A0A1G7Z4E5_9BACI|nr:DUF4363 family protein [Alteribacillus persepolensis]SDH03020.1 protein of unknown function [Alteribacillus persepolensis]